MNTRFPRLLGIPLLIVFLTLSCKNEPKVHILPSYNSAGGLQAVVEIPAGSNHKIEYNSSTGAFSVDTHQGKDRVIDFLPYPGNYGFIPSTNMDAKKGGDGDALDILIIGESIPTGTTVSTKPIGVLVLKDKGELDSKIIAIPADSTLQIINPKDYEDFYIRYNAAHHIIQEWFINYKGLGEMELIGWQNEQFALREIEKWQKKEDQ